MLDAPVRRALTPALETLAGALDRRGISASGLTVLGFAVGVGACVAAATGHWTWALVAWLTNRALDGLDGPLARRRGATALGGFLDIVADFTIYAGFLVGVAIAVPEARLACLVLLAAYYMSGTAFLALSSILERNGTAWATVAADGRGLRFVGGLAEGTETVLVYTAICLMPTHAVVIAWVFAAAVAVTALQRVVLAVHLLHNDTVRSPR
ncbi:MAG: CDP-alcohol phosphatidyltransferase family protein [Nocardioidaceae bacterium]|nr:CDP-alcohol phosphatidyltransferase family protein [Nocardioidaceae bacterium]